MKSFSEYNGGTAEGHDHGRGTWGRDRRGKALQMSVIIAVGVLVVLFAAVLAGCGDTAPQVSGAAALLTGAAANTVTVSGDATVTSPPDEAVIVLTVENDSATATAAMDTTSTQSNDLLLKLKSVGVEDAAIQTSSVTLYPLRTYDPNSGKESLSGYRAQNSVKVTLKDAATVAKVLAAAVETGVTNVSGPDWRLRDDSQAVTDALKQAVAHARAKADALASAAGVSVGDVISMSEGSVQVPVPIFGVSGGAATDSAKVAQPAVSAGTLDVTATVSITYTLKR